MAIPGSSAPNLMSPALAGPSLGSGPLPLPGQRDPWTYMVSPTKLRSYKGVILPALAKAWHTPGLHGNGRDWGRGEGYQSNMMQLGFVAVPHVMDCVAFGAPRVKPRGVGLSGPIPRGRAGPRCHLLLGCLAPPAADRAFGGLGL